MRSFTSNWLWKVFLLSIAVFLGINNYSWSQDIKDAQRDPSTITIVPVAPEGGRAVGDDCTDPIVVSVPAALPYNNSNYTCGRVNNYTGTCLGSYSGGEDIIYRLDATANVTIDLTMDPLGTTWTGVAIFQGCPNVGTCLAYMTGSASTPRTLSGIALTAGVSYYIMVDTWPSPTCISSFNLNIIDATPPPPPPGSCQYRIALSDTYGDGWNGCSIDVLVDGVVVLNNITLNSGYGPANFYFYVLTGQQITTTFTAGSYACETYYYVYNSLNEQVFYVPNNCNPIIYPGQLYGDCPTPPGSVEGYVFNYYGLAIAGATIASEAGDITYSGPDGYYLLEDIYSGDVTVYCTKEGYNTTGEMVSVPAFDTAYNDFTLTQPNIVINPLYVEETLNPGEFFTT